MSHTVFNCRANSGPSVGASSLVTDANSSLSGGPNLQTSASIDMESYLHLPASPMSFSSNNISISVSSVMDGSSVVQQSSHQDHSSQQVCQQQGASSATSQPVSHEGQPTGARVPRSLIQEPNTTSQMQKRPRLDIKQEDVLQQQVIQQLLQNQASLQLQGHNPQLQAFIENQRLRHQQQQQILQSMPQMHRAHLQQQQQQQQQQQLRDPLQQQGMQQSAMKRPYSSGVCARRLMEYIYHQRHRPPDNSIFYWRKFVTEYYAPCAKKRWCFSLYNNVGHNSLGAFPQAVMDVWQCDICCSKSGRGFESTFEVLPRLSKLKFDTGVIDELLFVDLPREYRFPSGIMALECGKVVQESVYEQIRVVHEGQLRVIFTHDLKILSWEFCARHHEELLPRRVVAQQVNQLVQVAQKYQGTVTESGSDGVSLQDLQTNCNMFMTAGQQLAKNFELQSLNDLGFSKRYVRSLQISEVFSSMKDLIDFSREHNVGPIESLKNYPRQAITAKLQMQKMQEMEQLVSAHGLPTDRNTLNKLMASNPGLRNHMSNNHYTVSGGVLNASAQAAVALTNSNNMLRQNSMNSNANALQQEASCSFDSSNQNRSSSPFQDPRSLIPGSMQNLQVNGLSSQQLHSLNANNLLQQSHPQSSQGSQNLQQHMLQQLLQEMMSNRGEGGVQQESLGGQNANGSVGEDVFPGINGITSGGLPVRAGGTGVLGNILVFGSNTCAGPGAAANVSGSVMGATLNRSNNLKPPSNRNSSMIGGKNSFNQRAPDVPQNFRLPGMVQNTAHEFTENGVFNTDPGDMDYGWKA